METSMGSSTSGDHLSNELDRAFENGMKLIKGEGIEQSYEKAFEILHATAACGHPESQFVVGLMYDSGKVVKQSFEKAFVWRNSRPTDA